MNLFFCPQCGKELESGARRCPVCGFTLTENIPDESSTVSEPEIPAAAILTRQPRGWGLKDTLLLVLLILLHAAALFMLFLVFFKWPHDTAVDYYNAEKAAYTQQISDYEALSAKIAEENTLLDDQIDVLQLVLDTGGEPADPKVAENAEAAIRRARAYRVEAPVIQADPIRPAQKDSVFHAREIMAAARSIDQSRFGLYSRYRDVLSVPDYHAVISELNHAETDLQQSIEARAQQEQQTQDLENFFMDFEMFVEQYCSCLSAPDEYEMNYGSTPEEMQGQFDDWIRRYNELDLSSVSDAEQEYAASEYARLMQMVSDASAQNLS